MCELVADLLYVVYMARLCSHQNLFSLVFLNFSEIFLYTLEHPDDSNQKFFPLNLFHSNMDFYSRFLELKLKFLEPIFVCLLG